MPILPIWMLAATLLATSPPPSASPPAAATSGQEAHHEMANHEGKLTLDTASGSVRIPIDLRGNHIYMRGRINDSDSLWIVLDSGASANVIDAEVAKALGMEAASVGHGRGAGGMVEVGRIPSAKVKLPGATLEAPIGAMSLSAFKRQTGRAMEAIIGWPLISRCVLRLDYAAKTLELIPAKSFRYEGKGVVLPITFKQNLPYVTARLTLPGRKPIEGKFVLDMGSSMALILSPQTVREQKANEVVTPTIEARGRGVGGQVSSRMGRVERLELGSFVFERPVTTMPIADSTRITAQGTLGNIGGEFLRRFTVYFDYSRKQMILEPNARLNDPFEGDMSGIAPRMGPDGSQALEVEWVQSISPAAEAGIKAADLIEQVDGKPALEVGVPGLKEMFRRAGETHRLTIRRGEERLEISLTTRRLI